jgi:hypothetical protein
MVLFDPHFICFKRKKRDRVQNRCLGASFVSVLISLVIGVALVTGVSQWHQVLKKTVKLERKKRQHLEIGRSILEFLKNDLRSCGYRGCRTMDDNFPITRGFVDFISPYHFFRSDRAVFGLNTKVTTCHGHLPVSICERLKTQSEVLIIYNVPVVYAKLKEDMKQSQDALYLRGSKTIQKGSVVLISDGFQGDLFIANLVKGNKIDHQKTVQTNISDSLSKKYKQNAEIVELQTVAYYLGMSKTNQQDKLQYSLYRDDLFKKAVVIAEDVVDFQAEYGIFNPKEGMLYQKANAIEAELWSQVCAVRLKLKTKENQLWEYDVAIRNRPCSHLSAHFIGVHLNVNGPYGRAGASSG